MEEIAYGKASTLYDTLRKVLDEFGVPVHKVLGFGSDGASVMTGRTNGVAARLKQDNPHTVTVHCICHHLALAVSQACKGIQDMKVY